MAGPAVCRQSPEVGAGWFNDHVRICAGGAQQCAFLPQPRGAPGNRHSYRNRGRGNHGRGRYGGVGISARCPGLPGGVRGLRGGPGVRSRALSGPDPGGGRLGGARSVADPGLGESIREGRPSIAVLGRGADAGGRGIADRAAARGAARGCGRASRRAPAPGRHPDRQGRAGRAGGADPGRERRSAARRRGIRLYHDYGLELPMDIAGFTDLWGVSGGPAPRQGRGRWARNGNF